MERPAQLLEEEGAEPAWLTQREEEKPLESYYIQSATATLGLRP